MEIKTAKDIFEKYFVDVQKRRADIIKLQAVYRFVMEGAGGGIWRVDFKNGGKLLEGDGPADVVFTAPVESFLDWVNNRAERTMLRKKGREIKIEGDRKHAHLFWTIFVPERKGGKPKHFT